MFIRLATDRELVILTQLSAASKIASGALVMSLLGAQNVTSNFVPTFEKIKQ